MSATPKDGGAAFPNLEPLDKFNDDLGRYESHYVPVGGMSLRDYFAGQALPQAIAHALALRAATINPRDFDYDSVSRSAYAMADAMLKAREPKP